MTCVFEISQYELERSKISFRRMQEDLSKAAEADLLERQAKGIFHSTFSEEIFKQYYAMMDFYQEHIAPYNALRQNKA